MPITYKYGEGEVKALAQKAGKAQAAQQKLQMRFQKDMALMDYQFKLAAQQRAKAWELEKMEIASRNDFAVQEQERVQKKQELEQIFKAIDESKIIPANKKEELKLRNKIKLYGGYIPKDEKERDNLRKAQILAQIDPTEELIRQKQGLPTVSSLLGLEKPTAQTPSEAPVVNKPAESPKPVQTLGQAVMNKQVPLRDLDPADIPTTPDGRFIVTSPGGKQFTIQPKLLPEYQDKGFTAAPLTGSSLFNSLRPFKNYKETAGLGAALESFWKSSGYINK